jgi:hypothetical protein
MSPERIRGREGLTLAQVENEVARGARFVCFPYCVSLVVVTFKRVSPVYFIRPGGSAAAQAARFSLISLLTGWWGVPWGFIWTISTVLTNVRGGLDVTAEALDCLTREESPIAQGVARAFARFRREHPPRRLKRRITALLVGGFFMLGSLGGFLEGDAAAATVLLFLGTAIASLFCVLRPRPVPEPVAAD